MYEQFRNDIMMSLSNNDYNNDQISFILSIIDSCMQNYEIRKKQTALSTVVDDLPPLCKTFIVSKSVEGLSPKTLSLYYKVLIRFFRMFRKTVQNVETNDIRMFIVSISRKGTNNRTLDTYRTILNSFFTWAVDEEYLVKNPCNKIKPIKYERKQRVSLTQYELERLRENYKDILDRVLMEFMYATGCRVSEVVQTNRDDIDWQDMSLNVIGKGNKERTVWLNAKAAKALQTYLSLRTDDNEALFVTTRAPHNRIGTAGIEKRLRELTERTNLGKKVSPHIMRHTCATTMLHGGASMDQVQHTLGHSSIATTQIYAKTDMKDVKRSHNRSVI